MSEVEKVVSQTAHGRHGWRFIYRDYGRRPAMRDYAPVKTKRVNRTAKNYATNRLKALDAALAELHQGHFIQGDMLVKVCNAHGVKICKNVLFQLKYMNELDVSTEVLRHKNSRGDFNRCSFHGIFSVVEYLIAHTIAG